MAQRNPDDLNSKFISRSTPAPKSSPSFPPGRDADFVIWSPEEGLTITEAMIQHRHKVTPYAGARLKGVVKETWLRGEKISDVPRGMLLR